MKSSPIRAWPENSVDELAKSSSSRMGAKRTSWVRVVPDGLTPSGGGGGALPRIGKRLKETFPRLLIIEIKYLSGAYCSRRR
jgi:hypothetical protein